MLRPVIRSGGMPRPVSAPRIGARASGVRTEMRPARVEGLATTSAASAGMADSYVGSSASAPASAASLGGTLDDKRRSRNRQHARECHDKPPEHGRLPRLHLLHLPLGQV